MSTIVVGTRPPTYVAETNPITPVLASTILIFCDGDSLTGGRVGEGYHTWRSRLQALAAATVGFPTLNFVGPLTTGDTADPENNGVSGSGIVTHTGSVLTTNLGTYTPHLLIMMLGMNDAATIEVDLNAYMLYWATAYDTNNALRLLWLGPTLSTDTPREARLAKMRSRLARAGNRMRGERPGMKLLTLDVGPALVPGDMADSLHPTAAGHDKIGDYMWSTFKAAIGFVSGTANLYSDYRSFTAGLTTLDTATNPSTGGQPVVTLSGTGVGTGVISTPWGVKCEVMASGTLGVATVRTSSDNGATWNATVATAASVSIGATGLSLAFAAGTYTAGVTYDGVWLQTVASSPNTFSSGDIVRVAPSLPGLLTAGSNNGGPCIINHSASDDSIGAAVPANSGIGKPWTVFLVMKITALDATYRTIFQLSALAAAGLCRFEARTADFRFRRQDDLSVVTNAAGGTPDATAWHIFEVHFSGTVLNVYVDGTLSYTNTLGVTGSTTLDQLFISRGGVASALDARWTDVRYYNADMDAGSSADIRATLQALNGL